MKLLILEDDAAFASLVVRALDGLFTSAEIVDSWEKAEPLLIESSAAWFDLRIYSLDGRSVTAEEGVENIGQVRKKCPDLVIIVGSGFISPEMRAKLDRAGVDQVFYKGSGFSPEQVAAIIIGAIMRASMRSGETVRALLDKALQWHHRKYPDLIPSRGP